MAAFTESVARAAFDLKNQHRPSGAPPPWDTIKLTRLIANLTRTCILIIALVAVLGANLAGAATVIQKVSDQSAVTTLNDGSAAEQAFIFTGLSKGRDLTHWQTGRALRKTLEAAIGPGGHALKVSLAQPPSPQRGIAGVIYIGLSTESSLIWRLTPQVTRSCRSSCRTRPSFPKSVQRVRFDAYRVASAGTGRGTSTYSFG